MALVHITEYAERKDGVLVEPALANQSKTPSGTAQASDAFNAKTKFVELTAVATCAFEFGTAPVAVTTDARLIAGETVVREVPVNKSYKVSVIT